MSTTPPTRSDADLVEVASAQWAARYPAREGFRALAAIVRTYDAALKAVEARLRPMGLTLSRVEALLVLAFSRQPSMPVMRLRDLLMIHGSSVTYLVDRLEAAGLVARSPDPGDRRVTRVAITDAGRALVDRAARELAAADFGVFAGMDPGRLEELADLLGEVRERAGGHRT